MEKNNDVTMTQLLNAVNNLTIMVNDLKNENELLKETRKLVNEDKKDNEDKKENKLEFLNKKNINLNNNYLHIIQKPIVNDQFIIKTNDLNKFYDVFKFYLDNVFIDYFKKNDLTWVYHENTNRLYVYDKPRNGWKQLGYSDFKCIINSLRNNINLAFMNWVSKQQYIQSEEFKSMYIRCSEKYFSNELTIKDYDKMKHLLYKYLKNMNK